MNIVKKIKNNLALTFFISIILVSICMNSFAETAEVVIDSDINMTEGNLEIPYNTTVNGNVTMNLGDLVVIGVINGDVFNDFGQINIIGVVNGDVETNLGQIKIDGEVGGDVKALMGDVFINGIVVGKLVTDLGKSTVNGRIEGDIDSGFGELHINGSVAGNIKSEGGVIIITDTVKGDITLDQGMVELGPRAVVTGRIYVGSGLIRKADSSIAGSLEIGEELEIDELQADIFGEDNNVEVNEEVTLDALESDKPEDYFVFRIEYIIVTAMIIFAFILINMAIKKY